MRSFIRSGCRFVLVLQLGRDAPASGWCTCWCAPHVATWLLVEKGALASRVLDIGGGFPGGSIDAQGRLDLGAVPAAVNAALEAHFPSSRSVDIIAEPGRWVHRVLLRSLSALLPSGSSSCPACLGLGRWEFMILCRSSLYLVMTDA